jgi:hypothetical protein
MNLAVLKEKIENALKNLMPDEKIDVKDGIIHGYHGAISCEETTCTGKRIGGTFEYPGWSIRLWCEIPSNQYEPADIDYQKVYQSNHVNSVAGHFVQKIFELKNNDYWQGVSDTEWAESCGEQW